jgi:nitroreductase
MEIYEALASRKTIRDFSNREINTELIKKIIAAGFYAPSNNHMREWHFILLQDKDRRKELLDQVIKPLNRKASLGVINRWGMTDEDQREMYLDAIPKQYSMLMNAACLILPCFQQGSPILKPKTLSDLNAFASIWCCIENILVAAASEGIFGVVRIPFEEERKVLKEFHHLPENYEIPCYIALGYPAEDAKRARQVEFRLEDRLHTDTW